MVKTRNIPIEQIENRLAQIENEAKALRVQKRVLKKTSVTVAPNKARAMLPGPDEIQADSLIWEQMSSCSRVGVSLDDLREAFAAPTWRKIINRLCLLLNCTGPDIVIVYRTAKTRECLKFNLIAFKNRINYRFRAFCGGLPDDDGKIAFWPATGTMTIPDTPRIKELIAAHLHDYFRIIIDVRGGSVFRANAESVGFRPSFSKREGILHAKMLNNIVAYAYRAEQNGEKEWNKVLRRHTSGDVDALECAIAKHGSEIGEIILDILQGRIRLPPGVSLKDRILQKYSEILKECEGCQ